MISIDNKIMHEFYTVEEIADMLKISKLTIYRYIKAKRLVAYKMAKSFRIKKEDFEKFLESRKTA